MCKKIWKYVTSNYYILSQLLSLSPIGSRVKGVDKGWKSGQELCVFRLLKYPKCVGQDSYRD